MKMTDRQVKILIGCLLHDVGKIIFRTGTDSRNHSQSGYDFLHDDAGVSDSEILNCVRYHHWKMLNNAGVRDDDICYLSYFADNIAAMIDRRNAENSSEGPDQFEKDAPLETVFNILNGNSEKKHYRRYRLNLNDSTGEINYPTSDNSQLDAGFYSEIKEKIAEHVRVLEYKESDISSLLSLLEANLSYVPSSTNKKELVDIPLYDHLKLTASFASCLEIWLRENNISDYRRKLFTDARNTYNDNIFLLYSMDISGIQNFIYTIASEGALKELRARSVYLEIMMEHLIDELLSRLSLSRANLIFSGGGHCYMILPNTPGTKEIIIEYENEVNKWFLDTFDVALYLGVGYAECSANSLRNDQPGSYAEIFRNVSRMISDKKLHRYSAEQIRALNSTNHHGDRECKVCRRTGNLNEGNKCCICEALEKFARDVMNYRYFVITDRKITDSDVALMLPFDRYMTAKTEYSARSIMESECYIRTYTKNNLHMGKSVAQNLWIGDYCYRKEFKELSSASSGIKRIAVLRADVDNLGNTFVNGFRHGNDDRYSTLTRSAVLSRQLSLFFKGYINKILSRPERRYVTKDSSTPLAVTVVYSGGDDVFLAGAWDSVVDAFINLRCALQKFSQNTLTISGGIGIYSDTYPINVMAQEVAHLEECSKSREGKNSITVFDSAFSYGWDDFITHVVGEKLDLIRNLMKELDNRGNSFLYNILELLRSSDEKINIARLVYLLSRLEPDFDPEKPDSPQLKIYRDFSNRVHSHWCRDRIQRSYLICALIFYVYLTRNEENYDGIQ